MPRQTPHSENPSNDLNTLLGELDTIQAEKDAEYRRFAEGHRMVQELRKSFKHFSGVVNEVNRNAGLAECDSSDFEVGSWGRFIGESLSGFQMALRSAGRLEWLNALTVDRLANRCRDRFPSGRPDDDRTRTLLEGALAILRTTDLSDEFIQESWRKRRRVVWLEACFIAERLAGGDMLDPQPIGEEPKNLQVLLPVAEENVLEFQSGGAWRVRYAKEQEEGSFPHRSDSVFIHLAKLLAEPHRRFSDADFFPSPPGASQIPFQGRDDGSDGRAMNEYEAELRRLTGEIKEATAANDSETADRLRDSFNKLYDYVMREKGGSRGGRKKKCGNTSQGENRIRNLRTHFSNLPERLRGAGLQKLADHLEKFIETSNGVFYYAPPPGTLPWSVKHPNPSHEKSK